MKLALQGHTILFSSGDTGVAGRAADPAPIGCLGPNSTIFNPRYPDRCVLTLHALKIISISLTYH